jgi:hypothetical protein
MNHLVILLLSIVFISSPELQAEIHSSTFTNRSSQLHTVLMEQNLALVFAELIHLTDNVTSCHNPTPSSTKCITLFRQKSSNQLLQPLALLLMALGLIGLGLATRFK